MTRKKMFSDKNQRGVKHFYLKKKTFLVEMSIYGEN